MRLEAGARSIRIDTRALSDLPRISGDAEQLHQVFLNLLLNAIAASPENGRVEVSGARISHDAQTTVTVTVQDWGHGIPADTLSRVYDPFFTTREEGTGLGLSISHAIVSEHGGSITIESEPGRGCAATVTLPVAKGAG
jgi:signal transduction histidine kinase